MYSTEKQTQIQIIFKLFNKNGFEYFCLLIY